MQNISAMEPMMLSEAAFTSELSDRIVDLIAKSEALKSRFHPSVQIANIVKPLDF